MKLKYVLLSIILVLLAIGIAFEPLSEYYLNHKLEKMVKQYPELSYADVQFDVWNRSVSFDTLKYQEQENGIDVFIEKISLKDIAVFKLLFSDSFIAQDLIIAKPAVNYMKQQKNIKTDSSNKQTKPSIKLISFNRIIIEKGFFKVSDKKLNDSNIVWGMDAKMKRVNYYIDSTLDWRQFAENLTSCSFDSSRLSYIKFHQIKLGRTDISDSTLKVHHFRIDPVNKFKSGGLKPDYSVSWNTVDVKELSAFYKKSDILSDSSVKLKINKLVADEINYNCYKDKRMPDKKDVKSMPGQMIRSIPFPTTIDSIEIINSTFSYEERLPNTPGPGSIRFTHFNGSIYNLTNEKEKLNENKLMTAKLSTRLMNKETLYVSIYYDLLSKSDQHTVEGRLKNFDLTDLNAAFKPLAGVEFKRGYLESLDFKFNADSHIANGNASFRYNNMKVVFIGDQKSPDRSIFTKLKTTLANAIVIRKSNPLRGHFSEGEIQHQRNDDKSFLNFWWKSAFSGMKASMVRFKD